MNLSVASPPRFLRPPLTVPPTPCSLTALDSPLRPPPALTMPPVAVLAPLYAPLAAAPVARPKPEPSVPAPAAKHSPSS